MKTAAKKERTKRVDFNFSAPHAERASIAGDFNDWNPTSHPMKRDKKGSWKASFNLAPGIYQYRLYVDGEWQNDPNCDECVGNPYGTLNSVKKVE